MNLIRLTLLKNKVGLSRSTIYLKISQGKFPKPIHLGERSVGWLESEVDEWIQQQVEKSRSAG